MKRAGPRKGPALFLAGTGPFFTRAARFHPGVVRERVAGCLGGQGVGKVHRAEDCETALRPPRAAAIRRGSRMRLNLAPDSRTSMYPSGETKPPPPPPVPSLPASPPLPPPKPQVALATGITVMPLRSTGCPKTAEAFMLAPIRSARRSTKSPASTRARTSALSSSASVIVENRSPLLRPPMARAAHRRLHLPSPASSDSPVASPVAVAARRAGP